MLEPAGILGEIVARKRVDVAARLDGVSLEDLRARAKPTHRKLSAALGQKGARFVFEVKRASPSQGRLRESADPVALARAYAGAADAISVLTDTPYFGGSLADLEAVRGAFDGPILAKDFVVDVRQVPEARLAGADAVLVLMSVLDDEEARAVIAEARRLGMDALVETHDETEMKRAVALDAGLIGINNRDLRTLDIDLAITERLAALAPRHGVLVSESGISSRADVERLTPHVDAFLVGSALMRAASPAQAARGLAFGRVKVCGLASAEDAVRAARAGATYAGVVMAPGTPRAVDLAEAEPVLAAARAEGAAAVAVFRNEEAARVVEAARELALDAVQLHGQEDAAYIAALRADLPASTEIWAASGVGAQAAPTRSGADRTVFDTQVGASSGGTGVTFDWSKVATRPELPSALLAGGLNPENVRAASRVGAYALDVGSGVEAAPRRKDPAKLAAFFAALRPGGRAEAQLC